MNIRGKKGEAYMNGLLENIEERGLKDPWSAITHFIGMIMAMLAAVPLLIKAAKAPDRNTFRSSWDICFEYDTLYGASATYHQSGARKEFRLF